MAALTRGCATPVPPEWVCAFVGAGITESEALAIAGVHMWWQADGLEPREVVRRTVADAMADGWLPADLTLTLSPA